MSEEQVGVNGADTQGYNAWLESLRQRLIGSKWSDKLGNGVKSVLDDAVLTHYESMPTGWWWQRLVRSVYWYWHSVKGCRIR